MEPASTLPEFECVMSIYGCGKTTGQQLMAKIGDPTRFKDRIADGKRVKARLLLCCAPLRSQSTAPPARISATSAMTAMVLLSPVLGSGSWA